MTSPTNISTPSDELQRIARALDETGFVRLGLVFGSIASGRAGSDSDVDLAVAADEPLTPDQKMAVMDAVAAETGRPVDVVDLFADGGPILKHAVTTGRRIYCTDRTVYARVLSRMLFHEADVMPYYRRILTQRRQRWIGV